MKSRITSILPFIALGLLLSGCQAPTERMAPDSINPSIEDDRSASPLGGEEAVDETAKTTDTADELSGEGDVITLDSQLQNHLETGTGLTEVATLAHDVPPSIDPNQLTTFYEAGEIHIALVRQPSMNVPLDVPSDFAASFVGLLIAHEDDAAWTPWLNITDWDEGDKNNPYALLAEGSVLRLTVVDQTGAGSGEGLMKVLSWTELFPWAVIDCYDFGANYNDPDDGDYFEHSTQWALQNSRSILDCEGEVKLAMYPDL